jgi:hypothetical protein
MLIRVDRRLRRTYLLGRRLHHGTVGLGLAVLGAVLAWHDRRDRRDWLRFTRT